MKIAVVGAGVIGLAAGIRLREAGHDVTIHAERVTPNTLASDRAAAIWLPWKIAEARARTWAGETYTELLRLHSVHPSMILENDLIEYFDQPLDDLPWWADLLPSATLLPASECPTGFGGGIRVQTLVIDVPQYMPYLHRRAVEELGCRLIEGRVESLSDLGSDASIVINCAGLDGGRLAGESEVMVPRAGHTVRISKLRDNIPCMAHEIDDRELVYVIPRTDDCLLGGTDYSGDDSVSPSPEITARILERCARLVPEIRSSEVLEARVGVRPGRRDGGVRLDGPFLLRGARIVHCFGHGGAGHTLAWGCAREVVERVGNAGSRSSH